MTEGNNNSGVIAGAALAGGAASGYYGYKNAPSVLGKVNIERVLQHKIDTDIVRDKILKEMGEASKDYFEKSRGAWFNIEHAIPNNVDFFFNKIAPKAEHVTVKQLKEAIANGSVTSMKANGVEQLGNYQKAFGAMADDVKLTREGLGNILRDNHSAYNAAKKDIKTLVDAAPKLRNKYGLILAAAGAVTAGLLATVIASFKGNKNV